MEFTEITDLEIPELQIYRTLRDNASTVDNSFIADSAKVVNLLLEHGIEARSILATPEYYEEHARLVATSSVPVCYRADKKLMEKIVGHSIHHGVMMHGVRPAMTPLDALGERILMVDLLSKNENIGTIARTAAALGVHSLVFPDRGAHPFGRRALRVSMGYASRLKLHAYADILETISALKARGYRVFAAEAMQDATPLMQVEVPQKWVLLMGNEGEGLSAEVLAACDETVCIEMQSGVKSFNVGVAASILMYRFVNGG